MAYRIHPVLLCGGSGTRLWPLSTPERPKQFLALTSDTSMIENTALRVASSNSPSLTFSEALVIGSERHAELLTDVLPNVRKILEPKGRNTAPAVAAACLAFKPHDLILILPADHDIQDIPAFHRAIETAAAAAEDGAIVTFGVKPTHPSTGYGYIKASDNVEDALDVDAFVEKPDLKTAESYIEAGSYFWNAGIFLFKACSMLEALTTFAPDVLKGIKHAMAGKETQRTILLNEIEFAKTPCISIDYAVIEKASNVKTVPVNMGWSDVGGYRTLRELVTEKPQDNFTSGPVVVENSNGLYVRSEGPVIAVNGVSNLVIVATKNEVMVTPANDDAVVKGLSAAAQSIQHARAPFAELKQNAKDWMWNAFATWAQVGWDRDKGGFVEQLHMSGKPDANANRRVRVQARQVFSFANAIEMGWPERETAKALIDQGVAYIDAKTRHPESGFVHVIDADANAIDDVRDLYDHAFIILAGSAAYKASGNRTALKIAKDAFDYINLNLKDHEHGGWFESSNFELPRRANSHMHLLEAMMAYYAATRSETALKPAAEIVRLFEAKFFNPATDVMAEFFNADWSPQDREDEVIWEPGHHYEWATLLHRFSNLSGHDSLSYQRRLIRRADQTGLSARTGFAINSLQANTKLTNPNARLWHQLERMSAHLLHFDVENGSVPDTLFRKISESYLNAGPSGGWLDELDDEGNALSEAVPASMLYHVTKAISVLLKA